MRSLSGARRWLVLLYLIGATNLVPGSFASFEAETAGVATFATGSMVLENKLNGETNCVSNDDDDPETGNQQEPTDVNARDCAALFTLTSQDPAGSSNRRVRLENSGTVDASRLTVAWTGPGPCTTTDVVGLPYHGTGDLCGDLRWYIQEYPDETAMDANDRTLGTCWYGDVTVPNDCGFQNNRDLAHFSATYPLSTPLELGALPAGTQRFFRVYLSLRGAAGNELQGRATEFGITWTIEQ